MRITTAKAEKLIEVLQDTKLAAEDIEHYLVILQDSEVRGDDRDDMSERVAEGVQDLENAVADLRKALPAERPRRTAVSA